MIEKTKIEKEIIKDPIASLKGAYFILSSINHITIEHGEQENTVEAIKLIDSIFYDALNLLEKEH